MSHNDRTLQEPVPLQSSAHQFHEDKEAPAVLQPACQALRAGHLLSPHPIQSIIKPSGATQHDNGTYQGERRN